MKHYSTYADIDRDLEILQLERQIHLEKMKLGVENVKDNLKVNNLISGAFGFSNEKSPSMVSKIFKLAMPFILRYLKKKI